MDLFLRTDPGSDSLILITHLSIFLQQGRARLLKRSCSRVAASENKITSDSECCIWKKMLFQPSVTKSCSLMGEQAFTLVFVSLDLLLPPIFSLSLNLHLLSHFSLVLLSPQLDSLPKPQHYTDNSASRMAAPGLVLLSWNGETDKYFILLSSEIWLHVFPKNTRLCQMVPF